MVGMQMRAQNEINVFGSRAPIGKPLQERAMPYPGLEKVPPIQRRGEYRMVREVSYRSLMSLDGRIEAVYARNITKIANIAAIK